MNSVKSDSQQVIDHKSGLGISSEFLDIFPNLQHISTNRKFSNPNADRLTELLEVRNLIGAPNSFLAFAEQKHTDQIGIVTSELIHANSDNRFFRFSETDSIICPLKNVTIAIQTADCAPIFLYDPRTEIIAITHAGWKGTLNRIASKNITEMIGLSCDPKYIVAWIGPMAGACCYEVSAELITKFRDEFHDFPQDKVYKDRQLDLVSVNAMQLEQAGLDHENIHHSNICTIHTNDQFYSYRADNGTNGRIISAMAMTGNS